MTETTTTPAPLRVTTGGPIYEPAPSVELESLAADVDREYRAHAATVKPLGKPGDWLTPAEHAPPVPASAWIGGRLCRLGPGGEVQALDMMRGWLPAPGVPAAALALAALAQEVA